MFSFETIFLFFDILALPDIQTILLQTILLDGAMIPLFFLRHRVIFNASGHKEIVENGHTVSVPIPVWCVQTPDLRLYFANAF